MALNQDTNQQKQRSSIGTFFRKEVWPAVLPAIRDLWRSQTTEAPKDQRTDLEKKLDAVAEGESQPEILIDDYRIRLQKAEEAYKNFTNEGFDLARERDECLKKRDQVIAEGDDSEEAKMELKRLGKMWKTLGQRMTETNRRGEEYMSRASHLRFTLNQLIVRSESCQLTPAELAKQFELNKRLEKEAEEMQTAEKVLVEQFERAQLGSVAADSASSAEDMEEFLAARSAKSPASGAKEGPRALKMAAGADRDFMDA